MYRRRWYLGFGLAALLLLLGVLLHQPVQRGYQALLVLSDIAAGQSPSPIKLRTLPPTRQMLAYQVSGRTRTGDLYLPGQGRPRAGMVLLPGIVPQGGRDPRLVTFASTLARAGFAVLVPDFPAFRQLQIRPGDARIAADAFHYLAGQPNLAPAGRAGMGAFSYAVGVAVLASLQADIRTQVRFILGVGGYHDIGAVVRFFTTGYFQHEGQWFHLRPDPYGQWVFVNSSLPYLHSPADKQILQSMVRLKLQNPRADLAPLAAHLGPEGGALYTLLTNHDPNQTPALLHALPSQLQAALAGMTLVDKPLQDLRARLILVHGMDDNLVPYPESIALARAVPPAQARLYLIHRILIHVEFDQASWASWRFWREDLPDYWRLFRAIYALLGEQATA